MATTDGPWPTIHKERRALADDLAGLDEAAWRTTSLCPEWSVQDVLGHMSATAAMTPGKFVGKLASAGFRFNNMTARDIAAETAGSPRQTLDHFRSLVDASTAPPGPVDSWLGETIVHSTDIRWPLGIDHEFQPDEVARVASFYRGSNMLIGAKRRIAGVTLRATDTDWTSGDGPEVSGPILALVMMMTGRKAAQSHLSGPGLATLAARP